MARNTRQTNSTIKELTFGANAPATTSFVRQHFQEVCRLHSFDQGSMRLCVYCVLKHVYHWRLSHCHDFRIWKLRLLQLYLTHKHAWKGNPKLLAQSGASIPPETMMHFPPVSDFPYFLNIFGFWGKFSKFYLSLKNYLIFIRRNF